MNARPKTNGQVKAIWAEARKRGLDSDALHDLVGGSIRALSYSEAERVIQKLKGEGFVPRRTLQYRRARQGVKQVVQESQLTLIAELASQRRWSAETLKNFCQRQCKHDRPRTTADANKVIEALKAMNQRDGPWIAAA